MWNLGQAFVLRQTAREISAASEAVATLHADIDAKLRRLSDLFAQRDMLQTQLADLSARVSVLQNTGGAASEIADLRRRLQVTEAELRAVDAAIGSQR